MNVWLCQLGSGSGTSDGRKPLPSCLPHLATVGLGKVLTTAGGSSPEMGLANSIPSLGLGQLSGLPDSQHAHGQDLHPACNLRKVPKSCAREASTRRPGSVGSTARGAQLWQDGGAGGRRSREAASRAFPVFPRTAVKPGLEHS